MFLQVLTPRLHEKNLFKSDSACKYQFCIYIAHIAIRFGQAVVNRTDADEYIQYKIQIKIKEVKITTVQTEAALHRDRKDKFVALRTLFF